MVSSLTDLDEEFQEEFALARQMRYHLENFHAITPIHLSRLRNVELRRVHEADHTSHKVLSHSHLDDDWDSTVPISKCMFKDGCWGCPPTGCKRAKEMYHPWDIK